MKLLSEYIVLLQVACLIRVPSEVVKQRAQVSPSAGTFRILSHTLYHEVSSEKKKLRCFILLTDVIHAQKYFFSFTPAKCSPGTFSSICLLVKVVDSMCKESKPSPSPHVCALKHKCLHTLNNFFFFFYIGRLCKRQGEMGRGEEGG